MGRSRAGSRTPPKRGRSPLIPTVRFPTVELFALQHAGSFAGEGLPLSSQERRLAEKIFGQSIHLDAVRIARASFANAPTTLGNTIRVIGPMSPRILIHELTHVWQFQTKGTEYISNSLLHQSASVVRRCFIDGQCFPPDTSFAYEVDIIAGKSFHDYTAEQQAVIVERYSAEKGYQRDAEYQRMIEQVRNARPLSFGAILDETAYGRGGDPFRDLPWSDMRRDLRAPVIPFFRLEWHW